MRPGLGVLVALLAACKSQQAAAPVALDAPAAAAPVVAAADAPPPPPPDAPLPDAPPPDAAPVDAAPEPDAAVATLYEKTLEGTVIVLGGDAGAWAPLPGATVTLVCSRETSPDDEPELQRCDSVLTVEKDGQELARAASGVAGIDWRAVAGNNGGLELLLFELESDSGAAYIQVRSWEQEGDEQMHAQTDEQLYALRGGELVEVLAFTSRVLDEPGPGGGGARQELETELAPGKRRTLGLRNLIATERSVKSGRTRGVVTYVWNGSAYVDKKTLPAPDAGAATK